MRNIITAIVVIATIFLSCNKSNDSDKEKDPEIVTCLTTNSWLASKVQEYKSCFCQTIFLQSKYKGQTVYEIRGIDPRCDGINMVYTENGTELFHSGDRPVYDAYRAEAQNMTEIWRCSKPAN